MKKTVLRNYATLIARTGVNIKPGQEVIIDAEPDMPDFVYILTEECYKAGAGKVIVNFSFEKLAKLNVKYCTEETLGRVEKWEKERFSHYVDVLPCRIYLLSEDPNGLKGINREKYANAIQRRSSIIKPYRDKMDNKYQWCIAAVPGAEWAKCVFPGVRTSIAIEKLWQAILIAARATDNPSEAWAEHNKNLKERCDYLNALKIKRLIYKSANGTDFSVGLMKESRFLGGGEYTLSGNYYNPNIPSEEVFTSPDKNTAEGIVYSTKPLSYNGQLIENFSIKFKNGKVIETSAEKNGELLEKLVKMDKGASFLGECALISKNSPINKLGITFYNTLFDENASCHLALGRGFTECIADYSKYTLKECHDMGLNDSIIHEDFMIGSDDLCITAETEDGKSVPIFIDGDWAF